VPVERITRYFKLRIFFALLTFRLLSVALAEFLRMGAATFGYVWCTRIFAFIGLSFGAHLPVTRGIYGFLKRPMYFNLVLVMLGDSVGPTISPLPGLIKARFYKHYFIVTR
jgi:hypothetical protein